MWGTDESQIICSFILYTSYFVLYLKRFGDYTAANKIYIDSPHDLCREKTKPINNKISSQLS